MIFLFCEQKSFFSVLPTLHQKQKTYPHTHTHTYSDHSIGGLVPAINGETHGETQGADGQSGG